MKTYQAEMKALDDFILNTKGIPREVVTGYKAVVGRQMIADVESEALMSALKECAPEKKLNRLAGKLTKFLEKDPVRFRARMLALMAKERESKKKPAVHRGRE